MTYCTQTETALDQRHLTAKLVLAFFFLLTSSLGKEKTNILVDYCTNLAIEESRKANKHLFQKIKKILLLSLLFPVRNNVPKEIRSTSNRGTIFRPGDIENRVSPRYFVAEDDKQHDVILANFLLA